MALETLIIIMAIYILSEDCVATPNRESQEFLQTLPESSGSAEPTEGPAPESCEIFQLSTNPERGHRDPNKPTVM